MNRRVKKKKICTGFHFSTVTAKRKALCGRKAGSLVNSFRSSHKNLKRLFRLKAEEASRQQGAATLTP